MMEGFIVLSKKEIDPNLKEEIYNNLYLQYTIIDINKVHEKEKELVQSNIYLPNLIRYFISNDYYSNITSTQVMDKLQETRKHTRQQNIEEFIEWIQDNPQYQEFLNKEELKKLNQQLKKIKKKKNNKYKKYSRNNKRKKEIGKLGE